MPSRRSRKDLPLAIVDTSVLVSILNKETIDNRAERSVSLLDRDGNDVRLAFPAIVPVELFGTDLVRQPSLPESRAGERIAAVQKTQQKLRNLGIMILDFNTLSAEKAADLIGGTTMKWPDASIVGSALSVGAERLYTWDKDMIAKVNALHPGLALEPELTGTLEESTLLDT